MSWTSLLMNVTKHEVEQISTAGAGQVDFYNGENKIVLVHWLLNLTAVIEAVQLEQVTVAELHTLANDVTESRDLGDDGGLHAVLKSSFTVVHHGAVVVGDAQRAGGGVVIGVKIVSFTCKLDIHKGAIAVSSIVTLHYLLLYDSYDLDHKCCLSTGVRDCWLIKVLI